MTVFRKIQWMLKPGVRLFMAAVAMERKLTLDARSNPDLWGGLHRRALVEEELVEIAAIVGLSGSSGSQDRRRLPDQSRISR